MRHSPLIYAFLLPVGLAAQTPAPKQVTDWIKSNAVRLSTVEAGHGFDDMQPLKKVVGDARIVSLGEATHGSREFFQLKHRMLEFLATQMGFTIFSIEANMPEAYRLNDYVLNGVGDPLKLIKGMYFWTWDTEEVLDMVRWMRDFNKSGKGRVEFTGFDMQTPNIANQIVRDFVVKDHGLEAVQLGASNPGGNHSDLLRSATVGRRNRMVRRSLEFSVDGETYEGAPLKTLNCGKSPFPAQLDFDVSHQGRQSLRIDGHPASPNPKALNPEILSLEWKGVVEHLEQSKEGYATKGISPKEIEWATQNARVVWQCMQLRANEMSRDDSMAANVKWILDRSPEAKIVLWAHNGHVGNLKSGSMGSTLRTMYGKQMVVFGFAFNEGSFQAISQDTKKPRNFTVPPAPANSLDATLASSGTPLFALDVRTLPKEGPVDEWFSKRRATRAIGAVYPENAQYASMLDTVAANAFDVVLFVEKTTAARKNPE